MTTRMTGSAVAAALATKLANTSRPISVLSHEITPDRTPDLAPMPRVNVVDVTWSPRNDGTMFVVLANGQRFRLIVVEEDQR